MDHTYNFLVMYASSICVPFYLTVIYIGKFDSLNPAIDVFFGLNTSDYDFANKRFNIKTMISIIENIPQAILILTETFYKKSSIGFT